jgi:acyl-coenzyme A thioesterase PaaI-like protein
MEYEAIGPLLYDNTKTLVAEENYVHVGVIFTLAESQHGTYINNYLPENAGRVTLSSRGSILHR